MIERRTKQLTAYQNEAYGRRYAERVAQFRQAETAAGGKEKLTEAVAFHLYKLMAIKDEFEVARLYSNGGFEEQLKSQFDTWDSLEFHLAPPLLAKRDDKGHLIKKAYVRR